MHTEDGEDTVGGMKLSRFGVQDIQDYKEEGKANFWVRPPAPGLYKFAVYAREVQQGDANRMYCAVVEYMVCAKPFLLSGARFYLTSIYPKPKPEQ